MNLDQTTIPLEPRRVRGCIDVAAKFCGQHVTQILLLWAHVALPAAVLSYIITVRAEMDVRLTFVVVYVATALLGVLTVAGAARAVFGESFSPPIRNSAATKMFRAVLMLSDVATVCVGAVVLADISADILGTDFVAGYVELFWYLLLFLLLCVRLFVFTAVRAVAYPGFLRALGHNVLRRGLIAIGPFLLLFAPGVGVVLLGLLLCILSIILAVRMSFHPESTFLFRLDRQLYGRGIRELLKTEGGNLFFRGVTIIFVAFLLTLIFFFTIDQASNLLLGYPILVGRLGQVLPRDADGFFQGIGTSLGMLFRDPRCLAVLTASALLVYPIARIAWFFCYIDLRVRRDCWDMELRFQQEARRLETTT